VSAYDELPDGVLVADAERRVIVLNTAGARLLGAAPEEVLGADYRKALPLADTAGRDWWECTRPFDGLVTRTRQPERELLLTDGPRRGSELLVTASLVRDANRRVERLVVAFRGTGARERLERDRADLVSTVAHELRSPLTSVKGFTATLLARWDRFGDDQKRLMLETVNADADRVTRLIAELLDVSRIDAGRVEVRRQVVDIPALVRRVVDGRVAAGDLPERYVVEVTGELPEMWVDPDKLTQVLGNLLENAVRHGAGTVTVTIGPDGSAASPIGAVITVRDEGEGVPEDVRARIFARFWRGDRRSGTGLGLYIVAGLVHAHGGTISVGHAPGGGAQFRFVLPAGTPSFL